MFGRREIQSASSEDDQRQINVLSARRRQLRKLYALNELFGLRTSSFKDGHTFDKLDKRVLLLGTHLSNKR
jgi:hypothetical protein